MSTLSAYSADLRSPFSVTPQSPSSVLLSQSRHPISISVLQLPLQQVLMQNQVSRSPTALFLPSSRTPRCRSEKYMLLFPLATRVLAQPNSVMLFFEQASTHSSDWVCYLQPFDDLHRTTPTISWLRTEAGLRHALPVSPPCVPTEKQP